MRRSAPNDTLERTGLGWRQLAGVSAPATQRERSAGGGRLQAASDFVILLV